VLRGLPSGWMPDNENIWFVTEQTGYAQLYEVPWADAGKIAGATQKQRHFTATPSLLNARSASRALRGKRQRSAQTRR